MKNHNLIILIIFTVFVTNLSSTEWVDIEYPYYDIETFYVDSGIADHVENGNENSGAISAVAGAWIGASSGQAVIIDTIWVDSYDPIPVNVEFTITTVGGTVNYGYGSFAGTRIVYGANNQIHYKDLEYGLSFANVVDKIISIAELAVDYIPIPADLTALNKIISAAEYVADIVNYTDLATQIQTIDDKVITTMDFTFWAHHGQNVIKMGVRSDAAGALTGAGFGVVVAQVSDVKYNRDALAGDWIPIPEQPVQWISYDMNNDGDDEDWCDYALKDNTNLGHIGIYHPYSPTPDNSSYIVRHRTGSTPPNDYLVLNNGLDGYAYEDEYIELDYSASDLDALDNEGTFEAWVKPMANDLFTGHVIYASQGSGNGSGDEDEIHLSCYEDGRFMFYIGGDGNPEIRLDSSSLAFYQLNQEFYHIAGTYKNTSTYLTANLYVNGEKVDWLTIVDNASIDLNEIILGKCSADERYFKGKMKGVKIHGKMLSDDEITKSYWQGGGDTVAPTTPVVSGEPNYTPATANLISWSASSDDISGVKYYIVKSIDNTRTIVLQDTTESTNYIFENLEHGIEYTYQVSAIDFADNSSGWSSAVSSIQDTLCPTTTTMNTEPVFTIGTENIVSWQASTDETSNVSYWIQCATDTTFSDTLDLVYEIGWIKETEYTFSDLEIGTIYYYRVKSRDEAGNESSFSEAVSSTQDSGVQFNTWFVSPDGNDSTGSGSIDFPLRNIHTAVELASDYDTIKVMDDGDSTTVDYEEYNGTDSHGHIVVYKPLIIERYDDDATLPQVKALYPHINVFYINSDNVTLRGLDIFGATDTARGIYLYESSNGTVESNICGKNSTHKNYIGIDLRDSSCNKILSNICNNISETGISLRYSLTMNNIVSENVCNDNGSEGILILQDGGNNVIYNNTCNNSTSLSGIHSENSGYYNTYSANSSTSLFLIDDTHRNNFSSNTFYKISAWDFCFYNTFANNNLTSNLSPLIINTSYAHLGPNRYFLNNLYNVETNVSTEIWESPIKIGYLYDFTNQTHKNYLGNYFNSYNGNDSDNDGIGDTSYNCDSMTDDYPLMKSTDYFDMQAWWLADSLMYRGNVSQQGGTIGINTGSSYVWISPEESERDLTYIAGDENEKTSWTGYFTFTSIPEEADSLIVEIGYADDIMGTTFLTQGPEARLTSDDFETNLYTVTFSTTSEEFTLPQGKYLAMKITNYGSYRYQLRTGGPWSFLASPVQNDGLVANFIVEDTNAFVGCLVQFTDVTRLGEYQLATWEWDFENDGIIDSYEQNPGWMYNSEGIYTVSLTVTDMATRAFSTEVKNDYISVTTVTLEDGLVAHYPFNNNTNDDSGNEFNATNYGATYVEDRFGEANSALSLDGNDWLRIHDQVMLQSETTASISFWIKTTQMTPFDLFTQGNSSGSPSNLNFELLLNDSSLGENSIIFNYPAYNTGTSLSTAGSFTNNQWIHFVLIKDVDLNKMKIYQNSSLLAEMDITDTSFTVNGSLNISRNIMNDSYYSGLLDDVRIYDRVLSENEIIGLYAPELVADFEADQTNVLINDPIQFTDLSTPGELPISTWEWDFENDGSIDSYEQNPEWTYTAEGFYTVSLTVTDSEGRKSINNTKKRGSSTETKINYITVSTYNLNDDLIAYFPFNGNSNDESGNNHHASNNGGLWVEDRFGNSTSAISMDGNDWLTLPDEIRFQPLSSSSISCWIKTIQTSRGALFNQRIGDSSPSNNNFGITTNPTSLGTNGIGYNFPGYNSGTQLSTIGNFVNDKWTHLVFIKDVDTNKMKIYENNIKIAEMDITDVDFSVNGTLYIGKHYANVLFYIGSIDDISLFDKALSISEIGYLFEESGWFQMPEVTIETINNICNLEWDQVSGATSYSVYSSSDPNLSHETWYLEQSGITDTNWSEAASGAKKFYFVKAVY